MAKLSRIIKIVIDGRYCWGFVSRRRTRYGRTTIRLTIYPPDITDVQRRIVRLSRAWPAIGTLLLVAISAVLTKFTELPLVVTAPVLAFPLLLVGFNLVGISRSTVQSMTWLCATDPPYSPHDSSQLFVTRLAYDELENAQRALNSGNSSWAEYRSVWEEKYWSARNQSQ